VSLSLDNRRFVPIENSAAGVVDSHTEFHFSQRGSHFEAQYSGGDIRSGHIMGHFTGPQIGQMLYHCETQDGALKAGRADAIFEIHVDGHITMALDWVWTSGADGSGQSKYVELSETKP